MKVRTISLCVSTALLISFSTSSVFADTSQVLNRGLLFDSDAIDWEGKGVEVYPGPDYLGELEDLNWGTTTNTPNVFFGDLDSMGVAVSNSVNQFSGIFQEPSIDFSRPTNFQPGDWLLDSYTNPPTTERTRFTFVFSDTNSETICGFGTQVAPAETGEFEAQIQAFDGSGDAMNSIPFEVTGSELDANAAFIGISSTTPMSSIQIVMDSTGNGSGSSTSWFAINQVTLTYCSDLPVEPEIPEMSCEGFAAPMAKGPVTAKKNRVFPLKMELLDEYGVLQTDLMIAAPLVTVLPTSSSAVAATDVNNDTLGAGHGSEGDQFDFTDDGIWQFNLKSKNYSASATYEISVVSGSPSEYVISPGCEASFVIK